MSNTKRQQRFAWTLSLSVVMIAVIAWGNSIRWKLGLLSPIIVFPLLGLVAFSLMWSHYIVSVVRKYFKIDKSTLKQYIEITSFVVLVAIFLHPGLLIYALFKEGFGLPPGSVINHYVAPGAAWAALLGTISFFVFLSYELRRRYYKTSWWKYVAIATDTAMLAILIHSLKLGSLLQSGWLRYVWYFYGITLVMSLGYIYFQRYKKHRTF